MNAITENKTTLEAARLAVIESLTRADRKAETGAEVKKLDETRTPRRGFRSVRMFFMV